MNILGLTDLDIGNPESLREFFDMNTIAHEEIFGALLESGIIIEHYPLDADPTDYHDWAFVHDKMHRAEADALGLAGTVDLSQIDFGNAEQASAWAQDHYLLHQLEAQALGI
jgi:hypothetical protein